MRIRELDGCRMNPAAGENHPTYRLAIVESVESVQIVETVEVVESVEIVEGVNSAQGSQLTAHGDKTRK